MIIIDDRIWLIGLWRSTMRHSHRHSPLESIFRKIMLNRVTHFLSANKIYRKNKIIIVRGISSKHLWIRIPNRIGITRNIIFIHLGQTIISTNPTRYVVAKCIGEDLLLKSITFRLRDARCSQYVYVQIYLFSLEFKSIFWLNPLICSIKS